MKRIAFLLSVIAIAGAALYYGERTKAEVPVTPAPIMRVLSSAQREATRVPMGMTRLSDDQEIEAGNRMATAYESHWRVASGSDDEAMEYYVQEVGRKLGADAHRRLPYQFHYVPEMGFVNAFALPGGHVFIGKGLIAMMTSEDQLGGVLGHEIEHIDHYHCAERLQVEAEARKIPLGGLVMLPIELFQMGYSKEQELEADREGIRLASRVGYSAVAAAELFATLDQRYREHQIGARTPEGEMSKVAFATLTEYFRSHPPAAERIAQIEHVAAEERLPVRQERELRVKVGQ